MCKKILLVLFVVALLIGGCDKKNDQPTDRTGYDNVKREITDAADASSDYIAEQKDVIVQKASDTYSKLDTQTKGLIANVKASGKDAWQKTSDELNEKLRQAQVKLQELKNASKDNLEDARDAFNEAIEELQEAYREYKDDLADELD